MYKDNLNRYAKLLNSSFFNIPFIFFLYTFQTKFQENSKQKENICIAKK